VKFLDVPSFVERTFLANPTIGYLIYKAGDAVSGRVNQCLGKFLSIFVIMSLVPVVFLGLLRV
jgi:hypothetical protein